MSDTTAPSGTTTQPPTTEPDLSTQPTATEPDLSTQTPAPPASADPVLLGPDLGQASVEEARASRDSTGFVRSGEIVPTTVPLDTLGRPILGSQGRTAPIGVEVPGRAATRVLASGLEIPAHLRASDVGEQRLFTTATRTMRNRVLYEIDAPIPLTRGEFEAKRRSKAVREVEFADGHDIRVDALGRRID